MAERPTEEREREVDSRVADFFGRPRPRVDLERDLDLEREP